eukprot:TRINITY_DN2820_c0_g1_i11.p7 TRINITY_DN2820_c0_g1~~TRINITY_DN2820_c0_g1_i11.p7  ORF type:complete len:142 (+),score=17.96 TRINITY_DN2820_c0_g1_i11:563-988(+)
MFQLLLCNWYDQDLLLKYEVMNEETQYLLAVCLGIMVGKIKEILIMGRHILAVVRSVYGNNTQFGKEVLQIGLTDEKVIYWYLSGEHIDISSLVQFIEQLRDSEAVSEEIWTRLGYYVKQSVMNEESQYLLALYFPDIFEK